MADIEARLMAIGSVDGRYAERTEPLQEYLSEYALIRSRVEVMAGWVSMLGSGVLPDREPLSDRAHNYLAHLADDFGMDDAVTIKETERTTNHDVKAVEAWLTDQIDGDEFRDYRTLVHFGCTSEDVNSSAYGLMLLGARDKVLLPALEKISGDLDDKTDDWEQLPMLALTHGQPATPTALGKEMYVYAERLVRQTGFLEDTDIIAKFSGATGGYNAAVFAYPEVDWPAISRRFVEDSLGLSYAPVTTQIEPHDWIARYLNEVGLANTILTDLAKDVWLYIMRGVLRQKVKAGEVGSSTMPHKVNPIDFENAEANFDVANGLIRTLAASLPNSRLQRDLSDSSRLRSIGSALGHSLIAYAALTKGLSKVSPNETQMQAELDDNWAVLTEAVQTVMRRYGITGAYDRIKDASRGQELDQKAYLGLVESLTELPDDARQALTELTPSTYLGYQIDLAAGRVK